MNYLHKLCLCIAAVISLNSFGMMRQVIRDEQGFRVLDGVQEYQVKSYDVDPMLRKMPVSQVREFLNHGGKLRASRLDNGDYVVRPHVDGLGGGGILAALAVTATLVVGGVATVGAAAGGFCVGGPAGAAAAAVVTAKATCAAAVYVAIATTVAPTP